MSATTDWGFEEAQSYRTTFVAALLVILAFGGALGGWAMFAQLDGAVVTHGTLLAESRRKTVENLEGGILAELFVVPGDWVEAGQPVARLDGTQEEALLAQMDAEREALRIDAWRLEAEVTGAPLLDPATAPMDVAQDRIVAAVSLFEARRSAHEGQLASLRGQVATLAAQAAANDAQARAAEQQIASWSAERDDVASLVESGAAPARNLRELDRNVAILEGARDEYAGLAQAAREDVVRAEADAVTLRQQRLIEATQGLSEVRRALAGLEARMRATADVLARRTLRAPRAGVVIDVPVVTAGAVIGSGTPVMEIVPDDDPLVVQTRLPPEAIDTVTVGRSAQVRLTAYRRASSPVIPGTVTYVSADLLEDPRDGTPYFEARVTLEEDGLDDQPGVTISAGMPVEVVIRTGERRAGDYILEPVLRHFRRAMRDE